MSRCLHCSAEIVGRLMRATYCSGSCRLAHNNAKRVFGEGHTYMPIKSKAQQRFMYAHKNDPGKTGKVAREFIAATPKKAFAKLPAKVKKK